MQSTFIYVIYCSSRDSLIEIIFHALLIILERQAADQLPGGKYFTPSECIKKASENVPTTNKASESDFAVLDMLIRTKPNSSVQTIQI